MDFWSVQGWLYDALFVLVPHRELVQGVAERLSAEDLVLDAGCGSGRLASWSDAQVVGADGSASVLRFATTRSPRLVQVNLSDRLPFPAGTFDAVVSLNVLYALPDASAALAEMSRVLRPGGDLLLATPTSSRLWPLVSEHIRRSTRQDWLHTVLNIPRLLAWAVNLSLRGFFEQSDFTFYGEDDLRALVTDHGLAIKSDEACYAGLDRLIVASKVD